MSTVEKWILDNDRTINTSTWLQYEKANRLHVAKLTCKICQRFVDKIRGSRNYSSDFIEGSINLRASSFKDHAKSDMHQRSMLLLKREQCSNMCEYAPIARSFFHTDEEAKIAMEMKFDIAYVMAKETIGPLLSTK